MTTKPNPLTTQAEGSYYSRLPIQPVQFSMANKLDACAHSILKYTTRHREKNGRVDLEKAIHFIELREVLATAEHLVTDWPISPEEYCLANRLPLIETVVILGLGLWLQTGKQHYAAEMRDALAELLTTYESTNC